jgi:hypothetical protein
MPVVAVVLPFLLPFLLLGVPPAVGEDLRTPSAPAHASCDCGRFEAELAAARATFDSRQEGVAMPLTPVMHDRYRARVDATFGRAVCLARCPEVPETARNRARVLVAKAGFKNASIGAAEWRARLQVVYEEMAACVASEPANRDCILWHASSRGLLARGSWNPLNITLPNALMEEFRKARGGAPPGTDGDDGAATRGEASMLLKIPRYVGGDPAAGRRLIEEARKHPRFACCVRNRLVVAEALARTGDLPAAKAELQAIVADGLPDCGPQRYENAMSLEEAARCITRLDEQPGEEPNWDDDCRRP